MNGDEVRQVKEHVNERMDLMQIRINERFEMIDKRIQDQFSSCQRLCFEKVSYIDQKSEKAHNRLDKQKESLECLFEHKNKDLGYRRAVSVALGIIALFLTWIGIRSGMK